MAILTTRQNTFSTQPQTVPPWKRKVISLANIYILQIALKFGFTYHFISVSFRISNNIISYQLSDMIF